MTGSSRKPDGGFSRRAFLKGSSALATASAVTHEALAAQEGRGNAIVEGATTISVEVNGESRKLKIEPRTTLLEALRYQLNLTGAKPVSLDGSSGASTVLVDGKPVMASTTLAITCQGKKVVTVEGLGGPEDHPLPSAFVENDAQQCGFCTPGFVVAVRAFLEKHPDATEEQIRQGLNGNICRCGTYANVLQAVLDVVKGGGNA